MFGAQFALMVQDRSLKRGEAPVWGVVSSDTNLHPRHHAKLAQNDAESKTLTTLRDALLPKLISGEVRAAKQAIREAI